MLKKKPHNISFSAGRIISFFIILLLFNLKGQSIAYNYTYDITNPFHDIFYNYYNYDFARAKMLIKKQFNNSKHKNHAYINYGLIQEYQKNYVKAEKYYRKALKNKENNSIVYLLNLYKNYASDKTLPLLLAIEKHRDSYWIDYEKAAHYIKKNDKKNCYKYLSTAIDKGFFSTDLLLGDPVFNGIKNSFIFRRILHKAKKKNSREQTLSQKLKQAKYEYNKNKPYGKIKKLEVAAYFEKTGRKKKAINLLAALVNSNIPFRDKSIALYWLARISANQKDYDSAKKYLNDFIDHLHSKKTDNTGYKKIIAPMYKNIILNDRSLKKIAAHILK